MASDLADFEAKVRTEWIDESTAAAWRKWHDKSVRFWWEFTAAILAAARLEPGQHVLDLAGGGVQRSARREACRAAGMAGSAG